MRRELYAGVMSGTSLDGIDAVVAEFASRSPPAAQPSCITLGSAHIAMPGALRAELAVLQASGADEIERSATASVALADLYATAIEDACRSARVAIEDLVAAGVHGQTVRHRPAAGWTVQLNDPARIVERTGVTVVADFRRRDIAAGGQGAPLVPAFHAAVFARPDVARAILNLGGIANLTLLVPGNPVRGFDTGPANVLLDLWHARHRGAQLDRGGAWAATGKVDAGLLAYLMQEPYFDLDPPKSTGRDLFDAGWLDTALRRRHGNYAANDVQATLVELTAATVSDALHRAEPAIAEVLVCGGGAHNASLMEALARRLAPCRLMPTTSVGVAVEAVEALAFAWLAREALAGRPGNLPSVTGARGFRVLGAVYPK